MSNAGNSSSGGTISRHLGVHFEGRSGKWRAGVRYQNKSTYVGLFDNELDAARACFIAKTKVLLPKDMEKYFVKINKFIADLETKGEVTSQFARDYEGFYNKLIQQYRAGTLPTTDADDVRWIKFNSNTDFTVPQEFLEEDEDVPFNYEEMFNKKSAISEDKIDYNAMQEILDLEELQGSQMEQNIEKDMMELLARDDDDDLSNMFDDILEPPDELFLTQLDTKKRDPGKNPNVTSQDDNEGNKKKKRRL